MLEKGRGMLKVITKGCEGTSWNMAKAQSLKLQASLCDKMQIL